jgi:hypothetical protein
MELCVRHSHSALRADASEEPTVADDVTAERPALVMMVRFASRLLGTADDREHLRNPGRA